MRDRTRRGWFLTCTYIRLNKKLKKLYYQYIPILKILPDIGFVVVDVSMANVVS